MPTIAKTDPVEMPTTTSWRNVVTPGPPGLAEVGAPDLFEPFEVTASALEDDAARLEDVRPLAQRERERRALVDEQDRHPVLLVQPQEELGELLHEQRSKSERELVDGQKPGLGHERPADRDHLLLPAGGPAGRPLAKLAELRQQGVDPFEPLAHLLLAADVPQRRGDDLEAEHAAVRAEQEVRLDRQRCEDVASFRHLADPPPDHRAGGRSGDVVALDPDPARGRAHDAARGVEDRRLAGSVRPDQGDALPRADIEGDPIDGDSLAVADHHVFDREDRHNVADPR